MKLDVIEMIFQLKLHTKPLNLLCCCPCIRCSFFHSKHQQCLVFHLRYQEDNVLFFAFDVIPIYFLKWQFQWLWHQFYETQTKCLIAWLPEELLDDIQRFF
jgi:hypothetical protein